MKYQVVFFGSFLHYSVIVLEKLLNAERYTLNAIVTSPPAPAGRHLQPKKTEVHQFAESHNIPVHTNFENLPSADFIICAGYGKLIPPQVLNLAKKAAINMHPSLLPKYPGRCPAEWAILNSETETGVTLLQMTAKFDAGPILAQASLPITPDDTRETLYTKLFTLGADLLVETIPQIASGQIQPQSQVPEHLALSTEHYPYARQITRQDGFVEFTQFKKFLNLGACDLDIPRMHRAFWGWPGVWTTDPKGHRIKLISLNPLLIQTEGKSPTPPPQP